MTPRRFRRRRLALEQADYNAARRFAVQRWTSSVRCSSAIAIFMVLSTLYYWWLNFQGGRIIVLTRGFMKFMTPNNPTGAFYRDLPSVLAAHGMPFLDISGELAADTRDNLEGYVIPIDRHPNERVTRSSHPNPARSARFAARVQSQNEYDWLR
jgi:hypothetical protein